MTRKSCKCTLKGRATGRLGTPQYQSLYRETALAHVVPAGQYYCRAQARKARKLRCLPRSRFDRRARRAANSEGNSSGHPGLGWPDKPRDRKGYRDHQASRADYLPTRFDKPGVRRRLEPACRLPARVVPKGAENSNSNTGLFAAAPGGSPWANDESLSARLRGCG